MELTAQEIVRMILPAGKLSGKEEKKRGERRETRNPGHTHSSMCDVYKYKLSHICYEKPQKEKKKVFCFIG